jgi:catechol 2,3-dioxygenase-like lactoylglutathione lyase family enzyme
MSRRRHRHTSVEQQQRVRDVLVREWDPIGSVGFPADEHEYDRYVWKVCAMLTDRDANSEEVSEAIAAYLFNIALDGMGLSAYEELAERSVGAAAAVVALRSELKRAKPKPVITATAAELFVADIKVSCDFFTEKLGFSIVFVYGEPPFYAQVKRDGGLLNLKCMDRPVIDAELRDRESLLSADMGLDTHEEIKQLFLEFRAAGVTFFQTLRREPWGAETFIVKDPDGNLLLFAGPAE